MANCSDCGTKLSSGLCPNCQEEAVIFTEQYEFLPETLSKDFTDKVRDQLSKLH
jgi:hypothetical protein